jgi:UDP-2,4-diacetamido-2,4,6-trideoxy-beta-L-altropyranose hydrolase
MNDRTAIFRVNAAPKIGGGHVKRCLALADALHQRGWRCQFIVNREAKETVPALSASPHCYASVSSLEDPGANHFAAHGSGRADLVVIDGYAFAAPAERRWRPLARQILVIDDLADRPHECDLLLDQTLGRTPEDYAGLLPKECRLLLGPAYALLRPEFKALRLEATARHRNEIGRVYVSFGLGDAQGLCATAAEAACAAGAVQVDIAVGSACPHLEALCGLAGRDARVQLHVDADPAPLMAAADLAIGAAGGNSWERCCLGLPTISIITADNQAKIAQTLDEAGAVINLGYSGKTSQRQVAETSAALLGDSARLRHMSQAAAVICDGMGIARTDLALDPERAKDGAPVYLRPAIPEDVRQLYEWQQAPDARRYARDSAPPSWNEHCDWLTRKLNDPGCTLCIIEHGERPVGMIRLDDLEEASEDGRRVCEVSILIEPMAQNQGIGLAALKAVKRLTMPARLVARVHSHNTTSLALFIRAGYRTIYHSPPFWRMQLDAAKPEGTKSLSQHDFHQ